MFGLAACGGEAAIGSVAWEQACTALQNALMSNTLDSSEWDAALFALGDSGYGSVASDADTVSAAIDRQDAKAVTRAIKAFSAAKNATNLRSCP